MTHHEANETQAEAAHDAAREAAHHDDPRSEADARANRASKAAAHASRKAADADDENHTAANPRER